MNQSIRLIISGKVQGVFYRQSAREKARELGLTGHVRNLQNGNVEIIATGPESVLEKLEDWCWQGPPRARVTNIQKEPLPFQTHSDFSIMR